MSKASLATFICLLTLAFVDLGLLVFGGIDSTVSRFVVSHAPHAPIVVFALNAVCGHLFWPMKVSEL